MNDRIKSIVNAATKFFLQQGYTKTQISHIAKAVGVSVGTIYLDFTGKKEIMHFVLKCLINPDFINKEFEKPITDDLFVGLEDEIIAMFEKTSNDFAKHLKNKARDYNLEMLVSDIFDIFAKYAIGCLFIEKNKFDFKVLSDYYTQYRKNFLETTTKYMSLFIERGIVRPLEHLELSTTMIIEILSWWAMDMRYISFEIQDIPLSTSKEVCIDNIVSAYKK